MMTWRLSRSSPAANGSPKQNEPKEDALTSQETGGVMLIPKGPPMEVIVVEVRPTLWGEVRFLVITIVGGALGAVLATLAAPLLYSIF